MSQIALGDSHSDHGHGQVEPHVAARKLIHPETVMMSRGSGRGLSMLLLIAGIVCVVATVVSGVGNKEHGPQHAMAAYHIGFMFSIGLAVASLGLVMILQQFNAGWSAAVRRQAENVSSCVWVLALLFIPMVLLEVGVFHGKLFHWMDPALTDPASPHFDRLAEHKAPFLNIPFWLIRAGLFFGIWIFFSRKLAGLSLKQDQTGDKWLTARARFFSSFGLLIFALSMAFASFDWLMSLDYHWFSTMFGVYYFAGSMQSAIALLIIILTTLHLRGKLGAAYTIEHMHDHGKLMFAFTAFWGYVTFCQYFLIWYGNIPEESAFYNLRVGEHWQPLTYIMVVAHFVVPFLLLLIRNVKRNPQTLRAVAIWVFVAHIIDIYFLVRPVVHSAHFGDEAWVDIFGILGPLCIFLAVVVRRVSRVPLIPINDPRLHEVIEHKNYI